MNDSKKTDDGGPAIAGDATCAEALRIAERHLIKQGWKFTPLQVAKTAREIITALQSKGEA
jgi:hypothetical protein